MVLRCFLIINTIHYENGIDALNEETKIKREFKEYQYKGDTPFTNGTLSSELFTHDILGLDI